MIGLEGCELRFNLAIFVRFFAIFGARVRITLAPKYCKFFKMSKNNSQVYYAVGRGKEVGVYESWKDCKSQIDGISNAKYRKFFSIQEAQEFVDFWKNYSSPTHERSESPSLVSNQKNRGSFHYNGNIKVNKRRQKPFHNSGKKPLKNGGEFNFKRSARENQRRQQSDVDKWSSPIFCRRNDILLGENINSDKKMLKPIPPLYSSPLISLGNSPFNLVNFNKKYKSCSQETSDCAEVIEIKRSNSVDDVTTPKKLDSQFYSCKSTQPSFSKTTTTPSYSHESVFLAKENVPTELENVSGNKLRNVVPKSEIELVDIESRNETEPNSNKEGEFEEVNKKLTTCLSLLESAMKLMSNQSSNNSKSMTAAFQNLLQKIISGTNISINPQMDVEESTTRKVEEPNEPRNCVSSASDPQPSPATHSTPTKESDEPQVTPKIPSSYEGRKEQTNVDVLALNLRLDAFEKRFDSCLKELGALSSEISHIKSEIKEIKETVRSGGGSPSKSGGLQQSTLKFDSPNKLAFTSPSRSYSTSKTNDSSEEPAAKRGRNLKRKLSRSDSKEENESYNDILSKIKVEAVDYTSFLVDADEYVEVYTDGSCPSNGKAGAKAGVGVWWGDNHPLNVSEPVNGSPTNNKAEIQAATIAIELAIKAGLSKLKVCTDSEFLINCMTKWIHRWKKNNWTLVDGGKVKNKKDFEKLDKLAAKIKIRWKKVEAHVGIYGNEMADRLANEGAEKYER